MLRAQVASGETLDVRQYSVHERMSELFKVSLVAHAENASIDFDEVVGKPASFTMLTSREPRFWSGVCNDLQQVGVEEGGLSTYELSIVPSLWFASQRLNYRMFQQISEPDIVLQMLSEWGVSPEVRFDKGAYKRRKYRVQYGESDLAFMCRMLEDAGVAFYFEQQQDENKLVLNDVPQGGAPRAVPIRFQDRPMQGSARGEHVTAVHIGQQVKPGKMTLRDHDYRLSPSYKLMASATGGDEVEARLERFHYAPGAFLFGTDKGDATPFADDRGRTRTDEAEANVLVQKRLDAERGGARVYTFDTNVLDLMPGVVMSITDHPNGKLAKGKTLLVTAVSMSGTSYGDSRCHCEARETDTEYRPPLVMSRPKAHGVESATVVGPAGEEIHTDEFGRVRVHFHWDRESKMDEKSSCWIHVSQSWGGAGYGATNLPRIGQEVIVDFLGGDPDRPIIIGRVHTNLQKTPYKLPENRTQSGLRSRSSPAGSGDNYNEVMFEDRRGQELLRMQAEKDLDKLVKNDERANIGRDRSKQVGRDDNVDVGQDRNRSVGRDETVNIRQDRSHNVGRNETIQIGMDLTLNVTQNKNITVGQDYTKYVAQNEEEMTGQNRITTVGQTRMTDIGQTDSTFVKEQIFYNISGGSGNTAAIMTDKNITFSTGAGATIIMDGATVIIEADEIIFRAKQEIASIAEKVVAHGSKLIALDSDKLIDVNSGHTICIFTHERDGQQRLPLLSDTPQPHPPAMRMGITQRLAQNRELKSRFTEPRYPHLSPGQADAVQPIKWPESSMDSDGIMLDIDKGIVLATDQSIWGSATLNVTFTGGQNFAASATEGVAVMMGKTQAVLSSPDSAIVDGGTAAVVQGCNTTVNGFVTTHVTSMCSTHLRGVGGVWIQGAIVSINPTEAKNDEPPQGAKDKNPPPSPNVFRLK